MLRLLLVEEDNAQPGRKSIELLLAIRNQAAARRTSNRRERQNLEGTSSVTRGANEFVIGIRYDENQDMKFRVKGSTNVRKLAQVFAEQRGIDSSNVSLLLHGAPLDPESEIASLSLDRDAVEYLDAVTTEEGNGNGTLQRDSKWVSVVMVDKLLYVLFKNPKIK